MFDFLFKTMDVPAVFGPFHLFFCLLVVVGSIVCIRLCRKCPEELYKKILFVLWMVAVILELGKQFINNYDPLTNTWLPYNFSAFPYQFCSLIFYVLPLIVFLKDSKLKDTLIVFYGTFLLFAGLGYYFFATSLCESVYINIQTLLHHGIQIVTGFIVFAHEFEKFTFKSVLKSSVVLIPSVGLAILLNLWFYQVASDPSSVNMFELNPINPTTAPVFSDLYANFGYVGFLIIYCVVFTVFALVLYFIMSFVHKFIFRKELKESCEVREKRA